MQFLATPSVVLLCTLCEHAVKRSSVRLRFGDWAGSEVKSLLCSASSFVTWHISWWEHLFEDYKNMTVTIKDLVCNSIGMWWCSNSRPTYLAAKHLMGAKKTFSITPPGRMDSFSSYPVADHVLFFCLSFWWMHYHHTALHLQNTVIVSVLL